MVQRRELDMRGGIRKQKKENAVEPANQTFQLTMESVFQNRGEQRLADLETLVSQYPECRDPRSGYPQFVSCLKDISV